MKTISIEIPEGKRAEWVDGVLTLVDEQPVEFKFKVGDKVAITRGEYKCYTIYLCGADNGKAYYWLKDENEVPHPKYPEDMLELYVEQPKDITERIKSFEDACEWCKSNYRPYLVNQYNLCKEAMVGEVCEFDLLAYLKLRIITCALNEGWEPTFEGNEKRFSPRFISEENEFKAYDIDWTSWMLRCDMSAKLVFKSEKLAKYAATQFKDIYMDFCYKGKE